MQVLKCQLGHVSLIRLDFKLFSAKIKKGQRRFFSFISSSSISLSSLVSMLVMTLRLTNVTRGLFSVKQALFKSEHSITDQSL